MNARLLSFKSLMMTGDRDRGGIKTTSPKMMMMMMMMTAIYSKMTCHVVKVHMSAKEKGRQEQVHPPGWVA